MTRVPLYKAAEAEMLRRIKSGAWPVGLRLPNEFGLAEEFGVSQGTMRRALMTLEQMGHLQRKPGRGTIVGKTEAKPDVQPPGLDRLRDASGAPLSLAVYRARAKTRGATLEEAALFGSDRLATLERMLKRGAERAALDEIVLPERLGPVLPEDGPVALSDLLEELGVPVSAYDDRVTAAVTSMADSVALSVDRHCPLLVLIRTAMGASGQPAARQILRLVAGSAAYDVTLGR